MTRRVEFRDTDAAGIAHFTAIFAYLEEAEHALLREAGLSVHLRQEEETISWPRVSAECQFLSPVRFEDLVDVAVRIERLGEKSVTYAFDVSHNLRPVARARMTSVCCRLRPGEPPQGIAVPANFREKLALYADGMASESP